MYKMSGHYKQPAVLFTLLFVATLLVGYACFKQSFLSKQLLPSAKSFIPWVAQASSDSEQDGRSTVTIDDSTQSLNYRFTLSSSVDFSYASVAMTFSDKNAPADFVNLSKYSRLKFYAKCAPQNVLSFTTYAYDHKLTDPTDALTFRIPTAFFSCDEHWQLVEIDLRNLDIPEWWLHLHKIKLYDRGYELNQVHNFTFGTSVQSPQDIPSSVRIADMQLIGRDWRFLYFFAISAAAVWLAYGIWWFKVHTRALVAEIEKQIQKDRPLVAYRQVSIESYKDKERSTLLHYMATEYSNPEISLETAISTTGINRLKINSILKQEVGLTFSAYLNKLRLTEAARLLSECPEANISEIAFSVGYNNVSYFNKLFKIEFGCSPKTFKPVDSQRVLARRWA